VLIEAQQDFAMALERLRRRDPEALAAFILSLAQVPGPVGDQVRTFIVGDDVAGQRAAGVMAAAAKLLPAAEVAERIEVLMAVDSYGLRATLARMTLNEPD
jgi:hypothetical protein